MASQPDWNPLLKNLEQLHKIWLKKAETAADDKARIRGVLFGIEIGSNRIVEEVAKPNAAIAAIIADWRRRLLYKEEAASREVVEGVDYGIKLVIECVVRFYEAAAPRESPPPRQMNPANGDPTEEIP
jgi:hypothetical protein